MRPARDPRRAPRAPAAARPARPARAAGGPAVALFVVAAAAAAGALAYLPSLGNGFVRDDGELIPALLRSESPVTRWLLADFWAPAGHGSGLWRPVATLSLWANGTHGGGSPAALHAGNLAMHAVASGALAALLLVCGLPALAALAGALWFAVMPVHAEAVAWVVGRTDVLCGLWSLAALALDRRARAGASAPLRAASLAAFALALLAKESAAPFALVVLALERADAKRPRLADSLRWLAPWLALTALWFAAHQAIARPAGTPVYVDPADAAHWPALAWSLVPHFALALLPGVAHAPDALPRAVPFALALPLTLAAFAAAGWLAVRRSRALPAAALFLAPLLPLLGAALAARALPSGERLAYLPSAGAAWLLALACERAFARGGAARALAAAAVAVLAGAGALAVVPLQAAWRDDAANYAAMAVAQPENPVGWLGAADDAAQRGDRAEAERRLARASTLGPGVPARHLVRAALHYRYGEWPAVLAAADSALALAPGASDAAVLRATALVRLRRLDEAAAATRALLAERPGDPRVAAVEGQRLLLAGDAAGAAAQLERAVRGEPDETGSWYSLGVARAVTGDAAGARAAFERVVALDPAYYDGWLALARAAAEAGDAAAAGEALARAAALPEAADGRAAAQRARLAGR